jgi:capsular exopolysaccharide synthesis family protein
MLIDADLRQPTLHDMFSLPNVTGLGDALAGTGDVSCEVFDVRPHLSVLTAGRPNRDPISALTSERMRQLIAAASAEHDWVIIDTPPAGLLPDADLLAAMVDVVILVVAAGRAHYRLLQRSVDALGRNRVFGVVLNRVASRDLMSGYHTYYEAYGSNS